jgi:uncharacterized membrane-anchored protein
MKTLPILIFALTVLAQWAAPLSQIMRYERTLTEGKLIRLRCEAPDPYDPLRGRYLAIRPEQRQVAVSKDSKFEYGQHAYATQQTGADGLTTLHELHTSPPANEDYVRVTAGYGAYDSERLNVTWPIDRFYLNEELAPEADRWFADTVRTAKGIIAEVRVKDGTAVLENLTFDGKSLH